MNSRLAWLEEVSRDRAVAELCRAWAGLTDKEVATVLTPYAEWIHTGLPTEEETEVRERVRVAMPDGLIALAIGLTEHMETEEIDRVSGSSSGRSESSSEARASDDTC